MYVIYPTMFPNQVIDPNIYMYKSAKHNPSKITLNRGHKTILGK